MVKVSTLILSISIFSSFAFSQPQFNSVQCDDISPLQYWIETAWNRIQHAKHLDQARNLEIWEIETHQNHIKIKTFEKMTGFITKCEIEFSNQNEWLSFRDFHLKSLEGD